MGTFDGFDTSTARPDYRKARAAGFQWVLRYLSFLPNKKVITASEVKAIHDADMGIILNWEFDARDALGGKPSGYRHGAEAMKQAKALGYPKGSPIFFSADFDVQPQHFKTVDDWILAITDAMDGYYTIGVYAPAGYLKHAHPLGRVQYFWQPLPPSAWYGNGTKWIGANIWQTSNGRALWGGDVDLDRMNPERRVPVWTKPVPVVTPPAPAPKPVAGLKDGVLTITQRLKVDPSATLNQGGKEYIAYLEMLYALYGKSADLSRLRVTSNKRSRLPGAAASYHNTDDPFAVDVSGIHGRDAQADIDMRYLAQLLYSNRGRMLELIHSTPFNDDNGFYVKDGEVKPGSFFGEPNYGPTGHINHVHAAYRLSVLRDLVARTKAAKGIKKVVYA